MTPEITNRAKQFLGHWNAPAPSPEAIRVAELLEIWNGLHHFDNHEMSKVDWTRFFVEIKYDQSDLATYDFDALTRLVFLSHDLCIRTDIRPVNKRYVGLLFHPRKERSGGMSSRHPTLEKAVELYRQRFPVEMLQTSV